MQRRIELEEQKKLGEAWAYPLLVWVGLYHNMQFCPIPISHKQARSYNQMCAPLFGRWVLTKK
jgi:hypothetical protein